MIGMDGHLLPLGHVVDHTVVGLQLRLLLSIEDDPRQLARGAVDTQPDDFAAPALGLLPAVVEGAEAPTLEEALAQVFNPAFDVGLVLRPAHSCRVAEEAARLVIFEEVTGRPRLQRVGPGDGRGEVVENQPLRHATEEAPGGLQASDALRQRIPTRRTSGQAKQCRL